MPQNSGGDLIYRRWWLGGGIVLLAAVLVLSLALRISLADMSPLDKVLHLLGYMILMLWFSGVVRQQSCGWVFAGLLLFGGAMEVLQSMIGYRSMEFNDLVANAAGLLLGWQLARRGLNQWCHRLEQRLKDR